MITAAISVLWIFLVLAGKDASNKANEKRIWEAIPDSAKCQFQITDKGWENIEGCEVKP